MNALPPHPAPRALFGQTLGQLRDLAAEEGLRPFAARQIAEWLYHRLAPSIAAMTNLPAAARARLSARWTVGRSDPVRGVASADGTRKYLFAAGGAGRHVETAWIPEPDRSTLCVSTQIGCKMGCAFCATARQGFQGQLSAGEILNQYASLPERARVTNLVYMGMGEPLDNLEAVLTSLEILTSDWGFGMSPRRITVSTVGLIPAMREYLARSRCHLALSLHSPFDEERRQWMPVQKAYPVSAVLEELRRYPLERQRRIMIEYICFDGVNDTPRHVREMARALNGIRARVNLMRFHPVPGLPLRGSGEDRLRAFQEGLRGKGIIATIRRSRGLDIAAACGLLSTLEPERVGPAPGEPAAG